MGVFFIGLCYLMNTQTCGVTAHLNLLEKCGRPLWTELCSQESKVPLGVSTRTL